MRYHLLALVHGSAAARPPSSSRAAGGAIVPAIVEPIGTSMRKRAVAVIATGRRLSADEVACTLKMLGRRLEVALAKRGLSVSELELVEE